MFRRVEETLEAIRSGAMSVDDLPPIQVITGPPSDGDDGEPWFFSLNNRRTWVLKEAD